MPKSSTSQGVHTRCSWSARCSLGGPPAPAGGADTPLMRALTPFLPLEMDGLSEVTRAARAWCGSHSTAAPPVYSQPRQASAATGRPRLAAVSVVTCRLVRKGVVLAAAFVCLAHKEQGRARCAALLTAQAGSGLTLRPALRSQPAGIPRAPPRWSRARLRRPAAASSGPPTPACARPPGQHAAPGAAGTAPGRASRLWSPRRRSPAGAWRPAAPPARRQRSRRAAPGRGPWAGRCGVARCTSHAAGHGTAAVPVHAALPAVLIRNKPLTGSATLRRHPVRTHLRVRQVLAVAPLHQLAPHSISHRLDLGCSAGRGRQGGAGRQFLGKCIVGGRQAVDDARQVTRPGRLALVARRQRLLHRAQRDAAARGGCWSRTGGDNNIKGASLGTAPAAAAVRRRWRATRPWPSLSPQSLDSSILGRGAQLLAQQLEAVGRHRLGGLRVAGRLHADARLQIMSQPLEDSREAQAGGGMRRQRELRHCQQRRRRPMKHSPARLQAPIC